MPRSDHYGIGHYTFDANDKIYDGQMYDYLYPIKIEDYQAIIIFRFSYVLLFRRAIGSYRE